jgi:hypothetical protein
MAQRRRRRPEEPAVLRQADRMRAAWGAPPKERLKRVLTWLGTDPTGRDEPALTEERTADATFMLRSVAAQEWRTDALRRTDDEDLAPWVPFDDLTLRLLYRDLRRFVDTFLRDGAAALPAPTGAGCARLPTGEVEMYLAGDERAAIMHGVAQLIRDHATHVRACKQCHRPFLGKTTRQEYDDPTKCGDTFRNRDKATRAKARTARKRARATTRTTPRKETRA